MKVKKNTPWIVVFLVTLSLHFGFDWNAPKKEKPAANEKQAPIAAQSAATQQRVANLPFPQMMAILGQNLTLWPSLSQDNKKKAVEAIILLYRSRQNTAILRPADFYASQIDQSLKANPALQGTDLMSILKILSVMEYDFYNGQDKEALAKEVLGEKMAQSVRSRHLTV